jgi:hypothetical protein
LFWKVFKLPLYIPDTSIFVTLVGVGSCKDLEFPTLQKVGTPNKLLHKLLQVEGSLLNELNIFRVAKETAFWQLWNVYSWKSLREGLSESFEFRELALDLEIPFNVECFHCVVDLSIAFYWVTHFDLREAFFVGAEHRGVENNTVIVSDFTILCTILQVIDKFFV